MKALAVVIVALIASQAAAQGTDSAVVPVLRDGMRVRVTLAAPATGRPTGIARSVDAMGFDLVRPGAENRMSLRYADVAKVEQSRGRRRGFGAFLGFTIGVVGGVGVGIISCATTADNDPCLGAAGFGLGGALLGPVVGALIAPERWRVARTPTKN